MSTGGRRTGMFFRIPRLRPPRGLDETPEFSRFQQHVGPAHDGVAERTQAERQDRIIAWFLVQPMNIATGRLGSNPMIAVACSSGK